MNGYQGGHFSEEENELNDKLIKEGEIEAAKKNTPMKIRKETKKLRKKER
jgi:hypothetical protein